MNTVLEPPPYRGSERAAEIHKRLIIADLHADSPLWGRDLLGRGTRGNVDIPRLIEGNVALQALTEREIEMIMGGNVVRLLRQSLP